MKGVELPINVLVIVAVAVIVLLGVAALFITGFSPFSTISGQESYKNTYCTQLTRGGCTVTTNTIEVNNFDANKDDLITPGTVWDWADPTGEDTDIIPEDNLAALCYHYYGSRTETACKKVCVCPGY